MIAPYLTLRTADGEIEVNPMQVTFIEPSDPEPGDPKIGGVFEPFSFVHFTGGNYRRIRGLHKTLKVLLEFTP